MNDISDTDFLYSVNQTLQSSPDSSQRDFSEATHISLGMTNILLKRFVQKGWIMMKKVTPRKIQYVLTPEGMSELSRRSRSYMTRTFSDIRRYSQHVETYILNSKNHGTTAVMLFGTSDISFIFEYACAKYGIKLIKTDDSRESGQDGNILRVYSEQTDGDTAEALRARGAVSVFDIAEKA